MAHNEITVEAPPERIFDVLADPRSFARWVVGSRAIRKADPAWPAVGSAADHAVGIGPFVLKDHSEVLDCDRPQRLRLLVKARPVATAYVTLRLRPEGPGTRIEMDEVPADGRTRLVFNRLTDPLVRLRNAESLKRLKRLAEGVEPVPGGPLPPRESPVEGDVTGSSKPASP